MNESYDSYECYGMPDDLESFDKVHNVIHYKLNRNEYHRLVDKNIDY